ncbi:hypothetical protein AAK967_04145 [Atopobiaceae bacterium 24-176]
MLQRDYLSKIIESFTKRTSETLREAVVLRSADGVAETEDALGELMELDPAMFLSLAPDSMVTMMRLAGNGEAVGDFVAYVLGALADAALISGDRDTARLRRDQARAVALAFGVSRDVVPEQYADVDREIQRARSEAGIG